MGFNILKGEEASRKLGMKTVDSKIKDIWSNSMGSGYVDDKLIASGLSGNTPLLVAIDDNVVAGFAAGRVGSFGEINQRIKNVDISKIQPNINVRAPVALAEVIVVSPNYRGQGLAKNLSECLVNELKGKTSAVFAEAWIRPGRADGSDLLKAIGFTKLYESDIYWMGEDSGTCNGCGNNPCTCSGELYIYY